MLMLKEFLNNPRTVAITGHSRGIGSAFASWFAQRGHHVIGMSRGNGYDIQNTDHIIGTAKECDIFINNAWHEYDQSSLMYRLHDKWQNQEDKLIIAVSSSRVVKATSFHDADPARNLYKNSKMSLELACQHLWNQNPYPRICMLRPGHTDTAMTAQSNLPKMPADQMVDYFMQCLISAPNSMFLQEICIRETHQIQHIRPG